MKNYCPSNLIRILILWLGQPTLQSAQLTMEGSTQGVTLGPVNIEGVVLSYELWPCYVKSSLFFWCHLLSYSLNWGVMFPGHVGVAPELAICMFYHFIRTLDFGYARGWTLEGHMLQHNSLTAFIFTFAFLLSRSRLFMLCFGSFLFF